MTSEAAALTEQIAELLARHGIDVAAQWRGHYRCNCGDEFEVPTEFQFRNLHRAHVAAEIAARLADSRPAVTEAAPDAESYQAEVDILKRANQRLHEQLADAWDEGYGAGLDYLSVPNEPGEEEPDNPYRLSPTGDDSER